MVAQQIVTLWKEAKVQTQYMTKNMSKLSHAPSAFIYCIDNKLTDLPCDRCDH